MKKVGVCGHFGIGKNLLNGQTVKTKTITEELENQLGQDQVLIADTHGGLKHLPKMTIHTWRLFKQCENIIILPAYKGLLFFVPLCSIFNRIFHRKLHYIVIGGWLNSYFDNHRVLEKLLNRFDSICVETSAMKKALESRGFRNIFLLPNCKKLNVLSVESISEDTGEPRALCTFSRVMEEKGIGELVRTVENVNEKLGRTAYILDIYGMIWDTYKDEFERLKKSFPEYICYKGTVDFDKSTNVLRDYFALIFPTKFYTEGVPGTIIDAYAAGIPVISAKWESYDDIIDEGHTGIGFPLGDFDALERLLIEISEEPDRITSMKENCLKKAEQYSPADVLKRFIETRL